MYFFWARMSPLPSIYLQPFCKNDASAEICSIQFRKFVIEIENWKIKSRNQRFERASRGQWFLWIIMWIPTRWIYRCQGRNVVSSWLCFLLPLPNGRRKDVSPIFYFFFILQNDFWLDVFLSIWWICWVCGLNPFTVNVSHIMLFIIIMHGNAVVGCCSVLSVRFASIMGKW